MDHSLLSSFIFTFLFSALLISPSSSEKCNPSDKKVLLEIKAAFGNPYILASWKNDTDCCSWYNVKCNSTTHRIYQLTIFDGELSGQIPAAIGNLPYLEMVDLNNLSNVTGPIPSALGKLKRLTFLRLNYLNLTGSIPSALGQLNELTLLYLNSNKLTGSILSQLTQLTNLNALNLSSNQLCGQIPVGGKLQSFDASSYADNKCLCGAPLDSCK
ncbi:hypothetical protein CDL15_Pgr002243 [Punica granatum]|uniref:Leucine-rich repeat-containing N-terminal plant-type domain-containing protein n=1 Tax=Punica granatum TaxID=22663 RepID=A0A218XCZ3_PUNGR|nr:hypothetical protein CDL15_Pgr002243 [Punica granatum]